MLYTPTNPNLKIYKILFLISLLFFNGSHLYNAGGGLNSFNQGLANKMLRHPKFDDYLAELKKTYKVSEVFNHACFKVLTCYLNLKNS